MARLDLTEPYSIRLARESIRDREQASYLAHARMFSPHALPALASETRGQNSSLIYNGSFGPQKVAAMSPEYWGL